MTRSLPLPLPSKRMFVPKFNAAPGHNMMNKFLIFFLFNLDVHYVNLNGYCNRSGWKDLFLRDFQGYLCTQMHFMIAQTATYLLYTVGIVLDKKLPLH